MIKCRCIIIDDEILARDVIKNFLKKDLAITVVDEAAHGKEAVIKILQHRPDLLFLDIQMPGLDGFEVIKEIWPHHQPYIVFTTAFDQYAIRAFEVSAADYLMKPFDEVRFYQALDRIKVRIQNDTHPGMDELVSRLLSLHDTTRNASFLNRVLVKDNGKIVFVKTDEIVFFSADGNYITIHASADKHTIYESLSSLEQRLDPENFMRVSRSFIVNVNFIAGLEPYFNGEYILHLVSGVTIKCTRSYRDNMKKFLSKMS